jgi:hypothetical protein
MIYLSGFFLWEFPSVFWIHRGKPVDVRENFWWEWRDGSLFSKVIENKDFFIAQYF